MKKAKLIVQNTIRINGSDIRIKQISTIHAHASTARTGW